MSLGDPVLGVAKEVVAEVGEVVVVAFVEVGLALVEVDGEVEALPKAVVGEVEVAAITVVAEVVDEVEAGGAPTGVGLVRLDVEFLPRRVVSVLEVVVALVGEAAKAEVKGGAAGGAAGGGATEVVVGALVVVEVVVVTGCSVMLTRECPAEF
jgi:hypothetical protein